MSEESAVGKNGIGPPRLAPALIYRPGDAGFPKEEEDVKAKVSSKPRGCSQCGAVFLPTGNNQKRCPKCRSLQKPPSPEAAKAIANLRQKAAPTVTPAPLPLPHAHGDLRAIAATYRQAAELLDHAAALLETH